MSTSHSYYSIKEWSEADRPREKLVNSGKEHLSNSELLAILIGSGSRNESAVDLCRRILQDNQHKLGKLAQLSVGQLKKYKGIGEAKAISIVAALEIGRRRGGEQALRRPKIGSSEDVFQVMQSLIGELEHEEFWMLMLNNSNKIIAKHKISKGGITGTLVDIRLVFKKVIEVGAVSIVLAHNHPSGTLRPSRPDQQITDKLKKAGEVLDVKILDHLIITTNSYFSFADEGLM
ncbi:MAG: RadC family protein [Bacteroidota bacterium]